MHELFDLHTAADARLVFFKALGRFVPASELIDSRQALGRVLAEPILSEEYLPPFDRSAMDGYAVRADDTAGASESAPVRLKLVGELPMGTAPTLKVGRGEAALIHTGGMLAEGADAVLILEQTQVTTPGVLEVLKPVQRGENLIFKGEDVRPGDVVLQAGRLLRPAEIGGLMALGKLHVRVAKKPVFAILSSGDEVIPPNQTPEPGQVRDINSDSLSVFIEQSGAVARQYPILPDDREQMSRIFRQAYHEADAVLITAGSSASSRDMTAVVIRELGQPGVLVHGINIRPGKPTILAVCDGKPVIGLPGNPISALVIAQLFVKPLIDRMLGRGVEAIPALVDARLTAEVTSTACKQEWIPVKLSRDGEELLAEPILFKSNLIFQLAAADGLMKINEEETIKKMNSEVKVLLF
jgi:molybdenum cofactor synthesis domain